MRTYPRNSPAAAARIVALVLIADGHVCRSEFDVFKRLDGPRELGLQPEDFPRIVQTLCEDLMMGDHGSGAMLGDVDASTMASVLAEVDEPALRRKVIRLALATASADRHLAEGEARVLASVRRHWGLDAESRAGQAVEPAL